MQITRRHQSLNLAFSIAAFFILVYLVFSYYSIGDRPWIFYNSDNIYVAYFYQDLIQKGGHLLQWKFSPVPYFFPDIFIYFLIAPFVHNLKIAILLQSVVQLALYYGFIVAIGKIATKKFKSTTLFHLSVLFSLVLLAGGYLQQETLQYALVSQQHFGAALMFLLGLLLILRTFKYNNPRDYIFLFLVCFLTIFSDIVFFTQFFATAMISLCVMLLLPKVENRKIYFTNIVVILTATACSYALYRLRAFCLHISINPHLVRRSHLTELLAATFRVRQNLADFYQNNAIVVLLLCIYAVITFLFIARIFWRRKKTINKRFVFAVLFLFTAMLTGYLSLLFADNDLMDGSYNGMRHYQPYMLFPVFLGIPLYLTRYTNLGRVLAKHYGSLIIAIVGCAYLFTPQGSISNIINFYPPAVACLDQFAEQHQLQNGIANYWEAKSYTFLSKKNITIAAIENNTKNATIQPELWISTMHDYVDRKFNFLMVENNHPESPNENYVQQAFGTPQATLECPAWENGRRDKIYIYPNGVIDSWMQKQTANPTYF